MNILRQYLLTLPPQQRADYARRAGTTLNYLNKAISVGHRFGGVLARRLDEASGGIVSRHELRPDIFGPPPFKHADGRQAVQGLDKFIASPHPMLDGTFSGTSGQERSQ